MQVSLPRKIIITVLIMAALILLVFYVSMKIKRDDRHIIIGVSNVDTQVKDRMAAARAAEEKKHISVSRAQRKPHCTVT